MLPMGTNTHTRTSRRRQVSTAVSSWTTFTPMALRPDGWWDASDSATLTQSGSAVSQWDDKSGWGRHFVQATAANQPVTGTRTQNGLTTVTFDGVNDGMTATNGGGNNQPTVSMFAVVRMNSQTADTNIVLSVGTAGTLTRLRALFRSWNYPLVWITQWGSEVRGTQSWDINGAFHLAGYAQTSTTRAEVVRDRVWESLTVFSGTMGTINSDNIDIGFLSTYTPTFPSPVSIGEALLFYRYVTIQERDLLISYFNSKWALF